MHALLSAFKALSRAPRFALGAIATLALGISISLCMFSVLWQVVYHALPAPRSEELLVLKSHRTGVEGDSGITGHSAFALQNLLPAGTLFGSYFYSGANYTGGERPVSVTGLSVTPGFFAVLAVAPTLGRTLQASDAGSANIVLSERAWRSYFAGDPAIVGKIFPTTGTPKRVVGVMPENLKALVPDVVYFDAIDPLYMQKEKATYENARFYEALIRAPEPGAVAFQSALRKAATTLNLQTGYGADDWRFSTIPLREMLVGDVSAPLHALMALCLLVLLIASTNTGHLIAARNQARRTQFAVRSALGAGSARMAGMLFLEGAIISVSACTLALLLCAGFLRGVDLSASQLPLLDALPSSPALSPALAVATLIFALLCTLLIGVLPAMRFGGALRAEDLRSRNALSLGKSARMLAVPGVACSLVALVVGYLYLQSGQQLQQQRLGLMVDNTIAAQFFMPGENAQKSGAQWAAQGAQLLQSGARISGVESVAISSGLPFNPVGQMRMDLNTPSANVPVSTVMRGVGGDIIGALGYQLLRGRAFTELDNRDANPVTIINQRFASAYFGSADPLGQSVAVPPNGSGQMLRFTVVGVVADARFETPLQAGGSELWVPFAQYPSGNLSLLLRSKQNPKALLKPLQESVWAALPGQSIYRAYALMDDQLELSATQRFFTRFANSFAAMALLLAAVGIYAMMSFELSLRQREFAMRAALGASQAAQLRAVASGSVMFLAFGLLLGGCGAVVAAKYVLSTIFGAPSLPLALSQGALTVIACAAIAIFIAAKRQLRTNISQLLQR
jgi:putative ABC transport system permease protein